jgi:hypothetical protein
LLVLTVTFIGFSEPPQPVYSNPVENCWNNNPANAAEEVGCGLAKVVATYGTITLACYALDAAATTVFPPAIAAAPVCNYLGAGGGVAAGGGSLFERLKTVMP